MATEAYRHGKKGEGALECNRLFRTDSKWLGRKWLVAGLCT
jgi:hypothetical protein